VRLRIETVSGHRERLYRRDCRTSSIQFLEDRTAGAPRRPGHADLRLDRFSAVLRHAPMPNCANCGRALEGPYCSACGQKAVELHRPLRELLSQAFEEMLSVDARLVRTLRPLLLKPGLVAREY